MTWSFLIHSSIHPSTSHPFIHPSTLLFTFRRIKLCITHFAMKRLKFVLSKYGIDGTFTIVDDIDGAICFVFFKFKAHVTSIRYKWNAFSKQYIIVESVKIKNCCCIRPCVYLFVFMFVNLSNTFCQWKLSTPQHAMPNWQQIYANSKLLILNNLQHQHQ